MKGIIAGRGQALGRADSATLDASIPIVSVTDAGGGDALLTLASPHGLTGSESFTLVNASVYSLTYGNNEGETGYAVVGETTLLLLGVFAGFGLGGFFLLGNGHTVLAITDDGNGNPLMLTVAPHGLEGGEFVEVTGNSHAPYNIRHGAIEAPSSPIAIVLGTPGSPPQPTGVGGNWISNREIESITDDGNGHALFTTRIPHGLEAPAVVFVTGTSEVGYNNIDHSVDETPSPTTWIEFGSYFADASGGKWAPI